jgi:hypothetical protein
VAALCLERVAAHTAGARLYDGKNWFPFSHDASQLLAANKEVHRRNPTPMQRRCVSF